MPTTPPAIPLEIIRRHVLREQGVVPGPRWAGRDAVGDAVTAIGSVQMDPLTIVARSHDLVLRNRVRGYPVGGLARALFVDRVCFEYGGLLAAHPIATLPHWRHHMLARRDQPKAVAARAAVGDDGAPVLSAIGDGGPMTARQVAAELRMTPAARAATARPAGSYRSASVVNQVLYHLWLGGDLMTHHRDGFERVYDLPERVAPADLLVAPARSETDAFFAGRAVRRAIVTTRSAFRSALGYYQQRVVPAVEANAILDRMIAGEQITTITVDGLRGPRFMATDVFARLDEDEAVVAGESAVRLLSPLDPLVTAWARDLFGFEHVWEIYKPADKRRWGPFTLPILFGEQLVGRIDAKTDRERGTLSVNGVWIERDGLADDPAFIGALALAVHELATFVGVASAVVVRTDPPALLVPLGRAIAG